MERKRIGEKRGRKRKFTCADFLRGVKHCRSFSSQDIAEYLRVDRSTISRFKANPDNKPCLDVAQIFLDSIDDAVYTSDLSNLDIFSKVPIIRDWDYKMLQADVSPGKRRDWIGGLMHLCKHLDTHPVNLTLEDASRVNVMIRELYRNDEKVPYGLNYARLRESIRGFFMRVHKVAPETLNEMGVTKEELKGSGRYSHQKVDKETRARFVKELKVLINDPWEYMEALTACKMMFYSGARFSPMMTFNFQGNIYDLKKDVWSLTFIEKGKHGGKPWTKYFIGHALDMVKDYFSRRFKIPIENLESELPRKVTYLFPSYVSAKGRVRESKIRKKVKQALINAGLPYAKFPPLHIWRHTFAQEFLSASNWNYELCATLGGWKTTHILRKHYGAMGYDPKIDGLREAMGITVPKEVRELRW